MEELDIEKQFGAALREWRAKLGISQDELAKRAGLHRTYVCDVERGARNVTLKNVRKLAEALDIPLLTIFGKLEAKTNNAPSRADELVDILLVDDSVNDTELTLAAFKTWNIGNRVFAVHDGAAALDFLFAQGQFAHRHPTDLPRIILLDLSLPKISGLEVLRRIKADLRTQPVPVVVLTGSRHDADFHECKRLGVENYISKPVSLQSFNEVSLRLNLQWILAKTPPPNGR